MAPLEFPCAARGARGRGAPLSLGGNAGLVGRPRGRHRSGRGPADNPRRAAGAAARRRLAGRIQLMFPQRLTDGYRAFLHGRLPGERSRYAMLAEKGQRPEIMVIGCVDSRVSPEVIFDAAPGELLVVRNVSNLVPPYEPHRETQHGTSAALEF